MAVPKWIVEVDGLASDKIHQPLAVALQAYGDLQVGCIVVQLGSETVDTSSKHTVGLWVPVRHCRKQHNKLVGEFVCSTCMHHVN